MIAKPQILPLARDASSRFLPWLIAFMVWLAALALAAVMLLSAAGEQWRAGLTGSLTVQIVPADADGTEALDERVKAAIALLTATPGISTATEIPAERVAELLEPWLGRSALSGMLGLPVPRLIDVTLGPAPPDGRIDTAALGERLAAAVPGASLDDHGLWLDRLIALATAVEAIAYAVLALIGVAAIATVVFATRTGLAIHHDVIELLHLMGAHDGYVARQFQLNALWLGLKGGIAGVVLAVATLIVLGSLAARVEAGLLPPLAMTPAQWVTLGAVAAAAAAISLVTARITVLRTVGRMP